MTSTFDRLLCFLGAFGGLALAALLRWRMITHYAPQWAIPSIVVALVGLIALVAALLKAGVLQRSVAGLIKLALTTGITFGMAEAACRVIDLDFNELLGARKANEAFPIYFRLPVHPSGEVYFTRDPGSSWTGKPLQTLIKNHRSNDVAYTDETALTIRYSREGFRNPDNMADWDVAVVGDSFTESGYLPEQAIFTGIAAEKLGKRLKNLGITNSGNFAQTHYLETYGKAPSCKTAVMAFFEGNDLDDNTREFLERETFRATGERPSRLIPHQPSLLKALWNLIRDFKKIRLSDRSYANAFFKTVGKEIPVTIADAPPSKSEMTEEQSKSLRLALDEYSAACSKAGMKAHLLYIPCKRRVMHDHLRQGADYPQPQWQLGDLPEHLQAECTKRGITFINPTPELNAAASKGQPGFNTIYDTHLDSTGHQIIGDVLAKALAIP
jgi:hypothetical protein